MPALKNHRQSPDLRITVARQMADYRKRMAEQLEAGLMRKSISREELAREAGVHEKTIKRLLAQEIENPRPQTIRSLAGAIDKEPADLWPPPEVESDQLDRIEKRLTENDQRLAQVTATLEELRRLFVETQAERAEDAADPKSQLHRPEQESGPNG